MVNLKSIFKRVTLDDAKHDYHNVFLKEKEHIEKLVDKPIEEWTVLIMGCGYRYSDVLLFSDLCRDVKGIDVIPNFYSDGFMNTFSGELNNNKSILRSLLYSFRRRNGCKRYYSYLEKQSGFKLSHKVPIFSAIMVKNCRLMMDNLM